MPFERLVESGVLERIPADAESQAAARQHVHLHGLLRDEGVCRCSNMSTPITNVSSSVSPARWENNINVLVERVVMVVDTGQPPLTVGAT